LEWLGNYMAPKEGGEIKENLLDSVSCYAAGREYLYYTLKIAYVQFLASLFFISL
jgi:hypothetical protein